VLQHSSHLCCNTRSSHLSGWRQGRKRFIYMPAVALILDYICVALCDNNILPHGITFLNFLNFYICFGDVE
jgi:hypothetical protein